MSIKVERVEVTETKLVGYTLHLGTAEAHALKRRIGPFDRPLTLHASEDVAQLYRRMVGAGMGD